MEIVLNSKFFTELSVEQLGEKTIELGYDGVDICVRPGHPIHVDNVVEALPKAMKVWAGTEPHLSVGNSGDRYNKSECSRGGGAIRCVCRSRHPTPQNRVLAI